MKLWKRQKGCKGGMNVSGILYGKMYFNDEDLLYLNRIGFMLLCEHGPDLHFDLFIESLRIL